MKIAVHSVRQELTLNVLWFCLNVQYAALAPIVIPTQILLFVSGGQVGRVQHIENFVQVTAVVAVLALGGGVISGLVFGIFSDHLKRRAPLVSASTICMSLAAVAFVVFPSTFAFWL